MERKFTYKSIKLEDIIEYVKTNDKESLAELKAIAYQKMVKDEDGNPIKENGKYKTVANLDKNGNLVYNHLFTKIWFCEKYMPDLIPVAKPKQPKASTLLDNI